MGWFALQEVLAFVRKLRQGPVVGEQIEIAVSGMTCGGCVNKLDGALRKLDGVSFVSVDLDPQRAVVGGAVTPEDVKEVVRAVGFETP